MDSDIQVIPARNGTATFVPAGKVIKVINSAGTQVVDLWAFALPKPEAKNTNKDSEKPGEEESKAQDAEDEPAAATPNAPKPTPKKKKPNTDLPSQEEAEQATREGLAQGESESTAAQKKGWSSYVPTGYVPSVPSLGFGQKKGDDSKSAQGETEQQKNSKTWGSYFTAGKGFTSYIPKQATETVTQLAGFVSQLQRVESD